MTAAHPNPRKGPMPRRTFVLATVAVTAAITAALFTITAALRRWGVDDVTGAACWAGLGAIALWGLADTASDRRHGRGEWAHLDEQPELDNTLRGDS